MTRRINYEDDIFTVALQVRCLQDTLKLEVDPDLFRERIASDLAWIDGIIGRLYQSLRESSLYVRRQDHLKELAKLKKAFVDVLDAVAEQKVPFGVHLAGQAASLRARRDAHVLDIEEIAVLVAGGGAADEEHIVSQEELRFLMTSEDDDGEA